MVIGGSFSSEELVVDGGGSDSGKDIEGFRAGCSFGSTCGEGEAADGRQGGTADRDREDGTEALGHDVDTRRRAAR